MENNGNGGPGGPGKARGGGGVYLGMQLINHRGAGGGYAAAPGSEPVQAMDRHKLQDAIDTARAKAEPVGPQAEEL